MDDEDVDCFAEKLVFTDGVTTFTPQYHGYCYSYSLNMIGLELDPRDYLAFIQIGFADTRDEPPALFVYTTDTASEYGYPLEAISTDSPINCTYFISNYAFGWDDMEYFVEEGILLFHFSTFINVSSLNLTVLELSPIYQYQGRSSNNTLNVTTGKLLTQPVDGLAINVAIRLSASDRMFLKDNSICTNITNCIVYWSESLAMSYHGYPIYANEYGFNIYRVWPEIGGKSLHILFQSQWIFFVSK